MPADNVQVGAAQKQPKYVVLAMPLPYFLPKWITFEQRGQEEGSLAGHSKLKFWLETQRDPESGWMWVRTNLSKLN